MIPKTVMAWRRGHKGGRASTHPRTHAFDHTNIDSPNVLAVLEENVVTPAKPTVAPLRTLSAPPSALVAWFAMKLDAPEIVMVAPLFR